MARKLLYFLKAKLDDRKYEAACVLFERVLCGYNKRELKGKLQVVYSDLITQLERIQRWDFVKAACPYVIQCVAQILSNRSNLGMSDRLSVAVTRFLATTHWCFLEAPSECGLDPTQVVYPAKVVQLFIELLVPCAHSIREEDLTFSLKCGIFIWQPLWKNSCPDIPSFKRPVLLERCKQGTVDLTSGPSHKGLVKYFDIIVLRSLSSCYLSEESMSWSLVYILQILQAELYSFCDISDGWTSIRNARINAKKSASVQQSLPLSVSHLDTGSSSPRSISPDGSLGVPDFVNVKKHFEELEPIYLSEEYEQWLKESGKLRHSSILDLVYKITQNASLRLCETLLYMLHVLLELGIVANDVKNGTESEKNGMEGTVDCRLETTVYCLLDLITMIGCDNNDSGIRGSKGQSLRILSHDMFGKLVSGHRQQMSLLLVLYIKKKSVRDVLNFLHSFTGLCFGKLFLSPSPKHGRPSLGDIGAAHSSLQSVSSGGSTSEIKERNEENLMKWLCMPLLEKLMSEEKFCKEGCREVVSKLFSYILTRHPKALRKMFMNGILNSFSKTGAKPQSESRDPRTSSSSSLRNRASTHHSVRNAKRESKNKGRLRSRTNMVLDAFSPTLSESGSIKRSKKLPLTRTKAGVSVDDLVASDAGSPETDDFESTPVKTKVSRESPSVSKANNNKFKIFKGTKRSRLQSIIYSPLDTEDNSPVFVEKVAKPKLVDLNALHEGMRHFRFITCFVAPGHLPEVPLLGALLDLKAPVLSRAALLLECCHFVHQCNKGGWDPLSRPEFTTKKDVATMLYKWGTAIGGKLEEIVQREIYAMNGNGSELKKSEAIERNVLHEGDISSISSECPYGIKLLACQLLVEITAYLRDHYLSYLAERDTPVAITAKHSVDYQRKVSSASLYKIKKTIASRLHAPVIAVQDETGNMAAGKRKISGFSRQGVSTSPKYQRKISRRTSKAYFLQSERRGSRQHKDNQHITSSFDEDDEIPAEASDFPWMTGIIAFVKSTHFKITHSSNENALIRLEKSWQNLREGLSTLYKPRHEEGKAADSRRSAVITSLSISLDPIKVAPKDPILGYLRLQVAGLQQAPFSVLCKAALVTDRAQVMELTPCAWQMLLHPDQNLAATAAAVVLIAGAQLDSFVTSFIKKEMGRIDPTDRAKAILRFGILWKYRFHVWGKMEKNAMATLKIPPPKIDYTLPSPLIGRDPPSTTDAPWLAGSPFPDETDDSEIIQHEWYYEEEKRIAAKAKRRAEKLTELRKGFPLTTVPLSRDARTGSKKKSEEDEDEDQILHQPTSDNNTEPVELFPPAVCAVALDVIRLMDDTALDCSGKSVGNLAYQTVWNCLVDDPDLFLRTVYEKITRIDKQEEVLLVLRKLIRQMPELPPVAGTLLFNNLAGVIMYYNRTNKPGCQEKISAVLNILWQVVPSVSNLFLKDMKQTLRKEYCDQVFMITANVPGVKELRVMHNKQSERFEIKENTTFASLITDCEKTFDVCDHTFVLVDKHSGTLMEKTRLVRDALMHKRGFPPPVIKLESMDRHKCYDQRQRQAFYTKMSEISRLNLSSSIFAENPSQKHVIFLFIELYRQSTFPRKAIDFEFELCQGRGMAKELLGLDVILKDTWVKFVCTLLQHLGESTRNGEEIEMFLNVLNGALLLLCEDIVILRACLAGFLNLSRHFGQIFAVNGYQYILPTLLRVYAQHQDNALVVDAVEFTISQFLTLHQSPFLLQLFASAAPIIQSEVTHELWDSQVSNQIPSKVFFKLLLSLDRKVEDSLGILCLVHGEKPIRAFMNENEINIYQQQECDGFAIMWLYQDPACKIENVEFSMIDIGIRLAVTVIAVRPGSDRGIQMLVVLSAIIPHYLFHLKQQTELARQSEEETEIQELMTKELKQLRILVNYMKVIIDNSKHLGTSFAKEFSDTIDTDSPYDDESLISKPRMLSWSWWGGVIGNFRSLLGWNSDRKTLNDESDRISVSDELPISYEERYALRRFCLPRMSLLYLVAEFVTNCASRAKELKDIIRKKVPFPEVIIERTQAAILTEVMSSMLSLAPKNQEMLSNIGLQRFMLQALASIRWTGEKETFFRQIVEKVNRILQKILSRPENHECINWQALEIYIRGIHFTIWKQRELSTAPQVKELINWCLQLILCDQMTDFYCPMSVAFANMAAKLAARLIQANPRLFSLPVVCGDYYLESNIDRVEKFLLNWLLPLCIRLGTGRYDYPQLSPDDIQFALSIILSFLSPTSPSTNFGSNVSLGSSSSLQLDHDATFSNIRTRRSSQSLLLSSRTYKIVFLGLKILIIAFQENFGPHWKSTAEIMERLLEANKNEPAIWDFFHFIVDHRSPLLVHLLPIVAEKVTQEQSLSNEIRSHMTRIERDLWDPASCPCKGDVLKHLLDELIDITRGEEEEPAPIMFSPPKGGRRRSKSTHNDRAMTLMKIDKEWQDYDKVPGDMADAFEDVIDGSPEVERALRRKRSSKKVTIASDPIVLDEVTVKERSPENEEIPRRGSKKILKRRPVLKRQSAEEEYGLNIKSDDQNEEHISAAATDSDENHEPEPTQNLNFNRQRFNYIRKKDESRSKTRKRDRWRRDNSYRYRQKMQHQVSFDEIEERERSQDKESHESENEFQRSSSLDRAPDSGTESAKESDNLQETGSESGENVETSASKKHSGVVEEVPSEATCQDTDRQQQDGDNSPAVKTTYRPFEVKVRSVAHTTLRSLFDTEHPQLSPSASSDAPLISEDDQDNLSSPEHYARTTEAHSTRDSSDDSAKIDAVEAGLPQLSNGCAVTDHEREAEDIEAEFILGQEEALRGKEALNYQRIVHL